MDCPQCHNNEISSSGFCLVCGYRLEIPAQEADKSPANSPGSEPDLPQWRKELSERLRSIRQKKHTDEKGAPPVIASAEPVDVPQPKAEKALVRRHAAQKNQQTPNRPIAQTPAPQQKALEPVSSAKNPREVEQLIDKAVSRRSPQSPHAQLSMSEIFVPAQDNPAVYEDKLILLSRTLAGLLDLMFVVLCTGIFIIASDLFSPIASLDSFSYAAYSALFLLIYLAYSIFFLSASTQTIGMMITDLRVVGKNRRRPHFRQILSRCIGHLLSLFVFGIGLAWSLFDSENRCFHDRISHTQVIRI
jgi:uncharacterized RDD family membrane protein YckC